ncbi:MAG: glycosyltransferase [Polyangiaceae bacterium]|nr:glycosyltransferase [Polyangiaceae bacterium]
MRVLHVLHCSLPFLCGDTIRSDRIMALQRDQGMSPAAVTSARRPGGGAPIEEIGGIELWRTPAQREGPPFVREWRRMRALLRRIDEAIDALGPDVVHASSPALVGLPALRAARRRGLPFVYEVRDPWEDTSVDRGKLAEESPLYLAARAAEGWLLRRADAVVTICEALREELAYRAPRPEGIAVVPNGVDTARFSPRAPREDLRARWGLGGKKVIGYVGALRPCEGLATLVAAMPRILAEAPEAHLLLAGRGDEEPRLRAQIEAAGLGGRVTLAGEIPRGEIADVYPLLDLVVYPRRLTRATALTTPLEPLEAMAMARPVLASDVPAMRELVRPGETGMLFRADDGDALAARAVQALRDPGWRRVLAERARAWVEEERQWPALVSAYRGIYAGAAARARGNGAGTISTRPSL